MSDNNELNEDVKFYHFRLNGRILSIAGSSRNDAKQKFEAHLARHQLSKRAVAHFATTGQPHPDAHHVIREDIGDLDEALDVQQRRERAMILRRNRRKIDRARELAQKRLAGSDKIKKRAYNQARDIVRKRVAGKRGAEYEKLGPSEKIMIDQAVEKKKKLIKKLALRLIPKVKRSEQERLRSFLHGAQLDNQGQPEGNHKVNEMFAEQFPVFSVRSKNPKSNVSVDDDTNSKKRQLGKPVPGNSSVVVYSKFSEEAELDTAAFKSLVKKSEKHGIDLDILGEVFDRGYYSWDGSKGTAEQAGFARVNSFINQGKSYFEEDADLQEAPLLGRGMTPEARARDIEQSDREWAKQLEFKNKWKKDNPGKKWPGWSAMKEDTNIQEISSKLIDKYLSSSQSAWNHYSAQSKHAQTHDERDYGSKMRARRNKGMVQAYDKLDAATGRTPEKPVKVPAKINEARPVNNPEYDESEKAWDERRKDFEKNFNPDGSPKKPKRNLKEDFDYDKFNAQYKKDQELRKKYGDYYHSPKGGGYLMGHDHDKKDHVIIRVGKSTGVRSKNNDEYEDHSVHIKSLQRYKDGKYHPLSEGIMKPYVKPHLDASGKQSGWKASNKYGKVKYFGKDFKSAAHRHAGIDLNEEIEKVGTYMTKDGAPLTLHRNTNDKKHHMLVNGKGQSVKGFYKSSEEVHKELTGSDHNLTGSLHEDKNSTIRKKMQTVERPDDINDPQGDEPTSPKSASNKHQQIAKKIIEQQIDPKKREVGTNDLVATYKQDTPGEKALKETAFSSDKKPVLIPAHKDGNGNDIPAKTVMRRTKRVIINRNDNPSDGK